MRTILPGLVVGLIFGAGLALSDMVNPARVLAFLDIVGEWDPTLAFVMGGAIIPAAAGFVTARRMPRPLLAEKFNIPQSRALEPQLLAGAALFGVGWGLAGLCPGPAIAGLALAPAQIVPFTAALLAGMAIHRLLKPSISPQLKGVA